MAHTEFKYKKILEDNKHCKFIPIEAEDYGYYAYLSTILLDSILVDFRNRHYQKIIFKNVYML